MKEEVETLRRIAELEKKFDSLLEKSDSIEIEKGKTGRYSFAVKARGDLLKDSVGWLERVKTAISSLNQSYGDQGEADVHKRTAEAVAAFGGSHAGELGGGEEQ